MDLTVVPFPDMNTATVASPHRTAASHLGTAGRYTKAEKTYTFIKT